MRHMSFALTMPQVRAQTKTVTRRLGWWFLKHGDLLQPVEKSQGLRKGERVRKIGGPIRVVHVQRQRLSDITLDDVEREGFSFMVPTEFIQMFCEHNGCHPRDYVNRIEFTYEAEAGASR